MLGGWKGGGIRFEGFGRLIFVVSIGKHMTQADSEGNLEKVTRT